VAAVAKMGYDALGRLSHTSVSVFTYFDYDGTDLTMERTNGVGAPIQRRYVHGPGSDEPLVWYEGAGISDRRFPLADERGSIIAITNASGSVTNINAYDEYGIPASSNVGRFGYTGQTWLPEVGMNYYKARVYSPTLGRFLQSDPIGYGDGVNFYNYVGGDPVNGVDPSGLAIGDDGDTIVLTSGGGGSGFAFRGFGGIGGSGGRSGREPLRGIEPVDGDAEIVVTAQHETAPGSIGVLSGLPSIGFRLEDYIPEIVVTAKSECGSDSDGPVTFNVNSVAIVTGAGGVYSTGSFTTPNSFGTFESDGFAIGAELGASVQAGRVGNLGTFRGFSANISVSAYRFGITGSRSDGNGRYYFSGGVSPGAAKFGISISDTYLNITSLICNP
jgi:RHS repeat-associated protein